MNSSEYRSYIFPALLMGIIAVAIGTRIPILSNSIPATQDNAAARLSRASTIPKQLIVTGALSFQMQDPPAAIQPLTEAHLEAPCHRVEAGHPLDITVPDGQILRPGEKFSKTWRLVNAGSCVWSEEYQIEWVYGDDLGFVNLYAMPQEVLPGETIDVTVRMQAPETPREYKSYWKLRSDDGKLFGLGPQGSAPFWADIQVAASGD